ncbi:MAG: hypothetical protein Q8R07_02985 [Candidatus Uhrbacteria bacterium]|nr:hypothetical protein [Candidatus Uhrbacteria bacterium]
MGKRIGTRIVQALRAVELLQPCTVQQLMPHMPGVEWTNVDKYCSRAVGHGLMTVDRSVFPKQYRTVPGWQQQLDEWAVPTRGVKPAAQAPGTEPATVRRHPLEQVWQNLR